MKVRAIGRGLVITSLVLLPLRLAVYLANQVLILAGYVVGVVFVVGIVLWFVGAVMEGYTKRSPNSPQA
jgi:hypothetical protein